MISTGIESLDTVVAGLRAGDNVVWQIDSLDDYAGFVAAFAGRAREDLRRLVYIRFARHKALLKAGKGVVVHALNPAAGFEAFSAELNAIITREGRGAYYVFDCLSELLSAWSNDLMVGNFFKITCPYLYELDTIAYFSLLRNSHSYKTVARIRDTTQLLIDVYRHAGKCYIHPLKVWDRYSPTMFLPHVRKGGRFTPISNSVDTARLLSGISKKSAETTTRKLDYWDRLFMQAEDLAVRKKARVDEVADMVNQLCRITIARDEQMLRLAKKYLTLDDFLQIKSRMIGTGFIGGKSVGMLIARKILEHDHRFMAGRCFEPHDSYYVGADVFYTYIVENGWWKSRMEQRTKGGYFAIARTLGEKLLTGIFPEEIKEQFQRMIDYYGQSPIIVRSSSLLEDSYGNAFAGKYESIFLVNQGSPDERYAKFVDAVRRIYASTMNEDALVYRWQRGLDQMDEQMALLVQRVSGAYHGDYFFPDAAGVGMSHNTFVWKSSLDPKAGMLRLVTGLGTRSVNRVEGDYPRIVALDEPLLKAHAGAKDARRFSQHDIDLLNIRTNAFQTVPICDLIAAGTGLKLELIATRDHATPDEDGWVVTFDELVSKGTFRQTMQAILQKLEEAYGYPVDIEFTVNFKKDGDYQINLLQCRPLQTKGLGHRVEMPRAVPKERLIIRSTGNFLGGNICRSIDRIIYVDPKGYCSLASQSQRYDIARAIGALNRQLSGKGGATMLLGPGRWGTTTPSLGIPVSFAEISTIAVLGEIAFTSANVSPEISFGTHFFQDLVEADIFYLALFPERNGVFLNEEFFRALPRTLDNVAPAYARYADIITVYNAKERNIKIAADIITQQVLCYVE